MRRRGLIQIGEVAERLGLSLRSIRHYEEVGLVVPERTQGGFRVYSESDVDRLALIRRMKPLGFTLDEVRDLLDVTDRLAAQHPHEPAGHPYKPAGHPDPAVAKRLQAWEDAVAERAEQLSKQLTMALEFAGQLREQRRRALEAGRRDPDHARTGMSGSSTHS